MADRLGIGVEAAFALLRAHARSHNLGLSDIARDIAIRAAASEPLSNQHASASLTGATRA